MVVSEGGRPTVSSQTIGEARRWIDVWYRRDFRIQESSVSGRHRLVDAGGARRALGSADHCRSVFDRMEHHRAADAEHLVLLVHAPGHPRSALMKLCRALRAAGIAAAPIAHAGTRRSLDSAVRALGSVLSDLGDTKRVSFVAYGVGGLVVRATLARTGGDGIAPHRMVLLAPLVATHDGARRLPRLLVTAALGAPSIETLDGAHRDLGPPPMPCVAIAGSAAPGRRLHTITLGGEARVAVHEAELELLAPTAPAPAVLDFVRHHPGLPRAIAFVLRGDEPRFH